MSTKTRGLYRHEAADLSAPGASAPAMLNKLADSLDDAWTAYTPTATAGMTVGNAVFTGAYKRIGSLVHVRGRVILGSTSSVTGAVRVSLPVAPALADSIMPLGPVVLFDTSANLRMTSHARYYFGTEAEIMAPDGGAARVGAPWAWANGDGIAWALTYEAAP